MFAYKACSLGLNIFSLVSHSKWFFSFTGSATRQAERAGEAAGVSALKTEKQNGP